MHKKNDLKLAYSEREVIIYSLYVRLLRPLAFGPGAFLLFFVQERGSVWTYVQTTLLT